MVRRLTRKNKPVVPEETCPYIDIVIDVVHKMAEQDDGEWRRQQAVLAEHLLEYIRESNNKLRQSGLYWYKQSMPN